MEPSERNCDILYVLPTINIPSAYALTCRLLLQSVPMKLNCEFLMINSRVKLNKVKDRVSLCYRPLLQLNGSNSSPWVHTLHLTFAIVSLINSTHLYSKVSPRKYNVYLWQIHVSFLEFVQILIYNWQSTYFSESQFDLINIVLYVVFKSVVQNLVDHIRQYYSSIVFSI